MGRKDFTQIAFDVVQQAIGAVTAPPMDEKKKAAIESGRIGGKKGGPARKKSLTKKRRREIAINAAAVRWKKTT